MESRKEVGSTNTGERGGRVSSPGLLHNLATSLLSFLIVESKETRPKALESAQDSGPQEGEEKASGNKRTFGLRINGRG